MGAASCKCEGEAGKRRVSMMDEKEPIDAWTGSDSLTHVNKIDNDTDVGFSTPKGILKKAFSMNEKDASQARLKKAYSMNENDTIHSTEISTSGDEKSDSGKKDIEESHVFAHGQKSFTYLVVGGGVAAGYACREFVERGVGPDMIGVVCAEPVCPYERPALSKAYLHPPSATFRARLPGFHTCVGTGGERQEPAWYEEKGIHILQGSITNLSLSDKSVVASDGTTYSYEKLFLATGSRAKRLDLPGADAEGIFCLRNEQDFAKLVKSLEGMSLSDKTAEAPKAVVLGASHIGLELAAALLGWGVNVTLVTSKRDLLIPRLLTRELDQWLREEYVKRGANVISGEAVAFETKDDKLVGVRMLSGDVFPCSLAIVGVGAEPNVEFCKDVLDFARGGLKVNHMLQTSALDVYAMGDICAYPNPEGTEYKRHCHVDLARKSASFAVRAAMGLTSERFEYLPYTYTRVFEYTKEPVGFIFYGITSKTVKLDRIGKAIIRAVFLSNGKVAGAIIMSAPTPVPEWNEKLQKMVMARPRFTDVASVFKKFGLVA